MFNFEVLNLEVDCKKAEQKILELFFKLDHDPLTPILLSAVFEVGARVFEVAVCFQQLA